MRERGAGGGILLGSVFQSRLAALGLLAATGIALSLPASAQDVYGGAGPGGYDDGYRYRDGYRRSRVYEEDRSYARDCRVKIIRHRNGDVTRVRRCD
jgi:hypothetical protein